MRHTEKNKFWGGGALTGGLPPGARAPSAPAKTRPWVA